MTCPDHYRPLHKFNGSPCCTCRLARARKDAERTGKPWRVALFVRKP